MADCEGERHFMKRFGDYWLCVQGTCSAIRTNTGTPVVVPDLVELPAELDESDA